MIWLGYIHSILTTLKDYIFGVLAIISPDYRLGFLINFDNNCGNPANNLRKCLINWYLVKCHLDIDRSLVNVYIYGSLLNLTIITEIVTFWALLRANLITIVHWFVLMVIALQILHYISPRFSLPTCGVDKGMWPFSR